MIGTMMSKTFTVAFFRSTIIAARTTRMMVVASGGTENAFLKGRGNRIADYLTDAAPADKAGNCKKYSKYGVFAISTVFSFCKKMMHIISRSAMVSTIERIFFFVELCQGTFNKSSRRTNSAVIHNPEYSTGTSGGDSCDNTYQITHADAGSRGDDQCLK